ncbi:6142_t:CDS:2 [Acaulospora morrowiae]|uniref:6142_t:CDS:1 n=1 Tax=Acaulospora morrowiae TaxID=94023 RepID=A0A9N9FPC2_9GLOM|nr:6142_t:CDS:2 [Acaulospora morrowiae]
MVRWREVYIKRLESEFKDWTSGNKEIDVFIRKNQLKALLHTEVIEWIPYNRFQRVEYLAAGGFGKIYTATWIDGYIAYWNFSDEKWTRQDNNEIYCLKSLDNSSNNIKKFLQEIENQLKFRGKRAISMHGITRDQEGNYMMVMQYAKEGSLREMLNRKYHTLSWNRKITILNLMNRCLDVNSLKRPTAAQLVKDLEKYAMDTDRKLGFYVHSPEIVKQIKEIERVKRTSGFYSRNSCSYITHPESCYTSRLINQKHI